MPYSHAGRVRAELSCCRHLLTPFHCFFISCSYVRSIFTACSKHISDQLRDRHLPREHMNPSPTYGGIQVQVKLLRPRSSSHMAFSSHGMPATPVQSSAGREYEGVNDFLVYMYVVQNMSQIYHCTKQCQEILYFKHSSISDIAYIILYTFQTASKNFKNGVCDINPMLVGKQKLSMFGCTMALCTPIGCPIFLLGVVFTYVNPLFHILKCNIP